MQSKMKLYINKWNETSIFPEYFRNECIDTPSQKTQTHTQALKRNTKLYAFIVHISIKKEMCIGKSDLLNCWYI